MTGELFKLLNDFGNASFDCGAWDDENDEDISYKSVLEIEQTARQALVEAIECLEAQKELVK